MFVHVSFYFLISLFLLFPQEKSHTSDLTELIRQLHSAEDSTRLKAAKELGKLGTMAREAIPALKVASEKDSDEDVRTVARKAIDLIEKALEDQKKGLAGLNEKITKDLMSKNLATRIAALRKIADMGFEGTKYDALVVSCMTESNQTLQRAAGDTLEKINPQIYKQVVALLFDKSENSKIERWESNSLNELHRLGVSARGALPALLKIYHSNESRRYYDRAPLLNAMVAIAPDHKDVINLLLNILSTDARKMSSQAQGAIVIPSSSSEPKELAIHLIHNTKADPQKATPALIICLSDPNDQIRVGAARTLAKYGPEAKAALPTLQKMKLDRSSQVRDAVTAAIAAIASE